ncbi:multiple epidermal growth factor-like domains protein 6 isoform X2 [Saccostrea cucullata]|uniref:multiple epidermal growth factor-like domains protein 6 isoform X2 n=1 Tax=Saccostrea cuccullata TaxID=36930 RepID=UPI002ED0B978
MCHCERNELCNQSNGYCSGSCDRGYYMDKCPTKQLVIPGYTLATSSSVDHEYVGNPKKTVDGDFRQRPYIHCLHTARWQKEAWLKIDLRKIYNISYVKFWYRNDSNNPSLPNTRRIQGYTMSLSNTSKTPETCFQHNGNDNLPTIIENNCKGVAENVWIKTNKWFSDGVILEICEVQVYGCSYQESSGPCVRCNQCKAGCKDNGECDESGCKMSGYLPPYCKECKSGKFGKDCTSTCGHCSNDVPCNKVNGSCPENCAPGWKNTSDRKCNQECDNESFGLDCRYNCSGHCDGKVPCNKVDGLCQGGCEVGWINPYCNGTCRGGFYGKNCNRSCGHCLNKESCDHVTGYCPDKLCEPGYKKRKCDKECDNGYFGNNCREACSGHCAGNVPCNKTDGTCPGECADGWIKPRCNETCPNGFYGKNCTFLCGHCLNKRSCDHVTGYCPSGHCEAGYKFNEKKCDEECDAGTFGYYCRGNCSGHCAGNMTCNKTDGICPRGCADGWRDSSCREKCNVGFYGKDCQEECGHCVIPETCHHVNGFCPGQCELGYQGDKCNRECDVNFYGKDCQEECGHCIGPETCHHINGSCPGQCEPGYQGDKCDFKCDNGTFGLRCNFTCAQGCLSVCNKINGTCDQCQYGFVGIFCNITVADVQSEASTAAAAGIGAFMLILVIIVIVLALILARKARQKKEGDIALKERKQASNTENNIEDRLDNTENHAPVEENTEIEYIVTDNGQKKTLIRIADLGRIIKVFSMEENKKFTEEFKGIPYGEQQHIPCSLAKLQQNMPKNRYKTTFPCMFNMYQIMLLNCSLLIFLECKVSFAIK